MNVVRLVSTAILSILLLANAINLRAQEEYDDMYFTPQDRKFLKAPEKTRNDENDSRATYRSFSNNTYSDNYSAKNVNPEYIARYRSQALSNNSIRSNPKTTDPRPLEYYPEDEANDNPTIINNYYGDAYNLDRWRFRNFWGFGFNPWFGWNSGLSFSIGWGDPFWDPFWGWGGFGLGYDPFFRPSFAVFNPFFGPSFGLGYAWGNNFWSGCNVGRYVTRNHWDAARAADTRRVVRGTRFARGGRVIGASRSTASSAGRGGAGSRTAVRASGSARNRRAVRDYTRTQNEYYDKSSRSVSSVSQRGAAVSRSAAGRITNSVASANGSSGGTGVINRSSMNRRRSNTLGANPYTPANRSRSLAPSANRSNSNRNYSTPSGRNRSTNQSYSRPNSSRSRGSGFRPSSSFRSSSPSRSYSPGRSSPSPSRSSRFRSSGGSRSSGGRGSSGSRSRSRGGN